MRQMNKRDIHNEQLAGAFTPQNPSVRHRPRTPYFGTTPGKDEINTHRSLRTTIPSVPPLDPTPMLWT